MAQQWDREYLQQLLLNTYFSYTEQAFRQHKAIGDGYLKQVDDYVLNDPEAHYTIIKHASEEDVFVRNGLFKRHIIRLYQQTCSMTGMRLQSMYGHSLIDACHIVPFSVNHDDRVGNGIALCPNLHRAFDRGLVSISADHRVMVSPHFTENETHPYSIRKLEGKAVFLPGNEQYRPDPGNLEWHREHVFKDK